MNIDKLLASISLLLEDYIIPVTQQSKYKKDKSRRK